jgi:hypothetical protein
MNTSGDCWAQGSALTYMRREIQMLNLAGWFVVGAVPAVGVVSAGAGWVFLALGISMFLLLLILTADTAGRRLAAGWTGMPVMRFLNLRKRPALHSRHCGPVVAL